MSSILGVETLQHTNGTTAATIDSSGRIIMPQKPAMFLQGNYEGQTTFNHNERFGCTNQGKPAFTTTANGGFIQQMGYDSAEGEIDILVAGQYVFHACAYHHDNNTSRVALYVNNNQRAMSHSAAAVHKTQHISVVLNLSTSDKVRFQMIAGSARTYYSGANHTYISAHMV